MRFQNGIQHGYNKKLVQKELKRVRASFYKRSTQITFYIFSKIANQLAETLNIDKRGIQNLRQLSKGDRKTRIILLPIYKSYADAIILHFLYYLKDLEPSFIFGNYEEITKIDFVLKLARGVGVLLIRRFP